jgi:hypothetical protein
MGQEIGSGLAMQHLVFLSRYQNDPIIHYPFGRQHGLITGKGVVR